MDEQLVTLLRAADNAASIAHDFIWERNGVTKLEASDAIWAIHNALRPLFEDDPEPPGKPQPSDGPDYHAALAFWNERRLRDTR